jgi:hypothetical protein
MNYTKILSTMGAGALFLFSSTGTSLLASENKAKPETPVETYKGPKEKLHVYLLIGQSNMAGRAPIQPEDKGVIDRCYLLDSEGKWIPAKVPLNIHSNTGDKGPRLNPGYTFAKAMVEAADKDICIGLVVNARGGSSINEWRKGIEYGKGANKRTSLYDMTLKRIEDAQKTGTFKGILWHQGETDYKDNNYLPKLKVLIENLRKDLGDPNLPFVAGQINNREGNGKVINDQVARLPETVPNTGFVSSEGLTTQDGWHFDTSGQRLLGKRYAEAMLTLHGK